MRFLVGLAGVPLGRKAGGPLGSDDGGAGVSSWGSVEDVHVPNRLPGPSDIRIQQGFFAGVGEKHPAITVEIEREKKRRKKKS